MATRYVGSYNKQLLTAESIESYKKQFSFVNQPSADVTEITRSGVQADANMAINEGSKIELHTVDSLD